MDVCDRDRQTSKLPQGVVWCVCLREGEGEEGERKGKREDRDRLGFQS